jgi:hypothetical protein
VTTPPEEMTFEQRAALVELENAATEPEPGERRLAWPTIREEAYHGLAGRVVSTLDPHTEADPRAVLFTFLSYAGCYMGNQAYLLGGNAAHPGRIWPILCGPSASGAKGTAVAAVTQLVRHVDLDFLGANRVSGLSSSEGLIKRVRDGQGDNPDAKDFDEGVADKRLWVVEPEYVNVLTRSRREGSALSGTVRDAFDGVPLQTLVSANPLRSTDPHITILGMITPEELVEKLTATDITNGFANRFMVVASKRSKRLPDGGSPPHGALVELGAAFRATAAHARTVREMTRTEQARELWASEYHRRMDEYDELVGPLGTLLARWHANTTRLSVIYALLDRKTVVDVEHVRAAFACWDYVEASTRYVFGSEDSDPELGRLVEYVDSADMGRTRQDISSELYQRRKTKKQLDDLCARLLALGRYKAVTIPNDSGRGRPKTVYVRVGGGSKVTP